MADDQFPTDDDLNKMYHEHLKDEFGRNKDSITERRNAFKDQLNAARGGMQRFEQQRPQEKPVNDNNKQPPPPPGKEKLNKEGLNNAHNTGQGKRPDPEIDKTAQKQRYKDLLREARGGERSQDKAYRENDKDVTSDTQGRKEAAYKANAKRHHRKAKGSPENAWQTYSQTYAGPGFYPHLWPGA